MSYDVSCQAGDPSYRSKSMVLYMIRGTVISQKADPRDINNTVKSSSSLCLSKLFPPEAGRDD
jgi:hypothetical protein